MYWTDWGSRTVERAVMDGSGKETLVENDIRRPFGLAIDHIYEKIYWADADKNTIEIYDLKNGKRDVIINEQIIICKNISNATVPKFYRF